MSGVYCDISSSNINFVTSDAQLIKHKINKNSDETTSLYFQKTFKYY